MLDRVREHLRRIAPLIEQALLPPASPAQLGALQSLPAAPLPDDLIALYRASAGLDPEAVANFAFGLSWLDIDSVIASARAGGACIDGASLRFTDAGIRQDFTHGPQRLEIGNDASHCRLYVDLDPAPGGRRGQVVFVDEEAQVALLLAGSVGELIERFEADLAGGRYTLAEDALADGEHWLAPAADIDVCNWHGSPAWRHAGLG